MKKSKKIVLFVGMLVSCVAASAVTVYGITAQIINSPKYKAVSVQAEINSQGYYDYQEKAENISSQISILKNTVAQAEIQKQNAESAGNPIGVLNAQQTINEAAEKIKQYKITQAEYILQKDLSSFYTKYNADIVNQQQNVISFDMYKSCLQVLLYDSQLSYISLQVSELQDKLEIEQAKFSLGYTTSISVDDINSKLLSKQTEYDTVQSQQEILKEKIQLNGGDYSGNEFSCSYSKISDDYYNEFINNSTQRKYYDNQITSYTTYLNTLSALGENYKTAQLQIDLASLNKQQYENDLKIYTKQMVSAYNNTVSQIEAKDAEIAVCEKKIQASQLLLEKGKIQKIQLTELITQSEQLKYEKQNMIYRLCLIDYIVKNKIENQSV